MEKVCVGIKQLNKVAIILLLSSLFSCSNNKSNKFPNWLIGEWKCSKHKFNIIETWKFNTQNNKLIGSTTWFYPGKKSTENFELYEKNNSIYFTVKINGEDEIFNVNQSNKNLLSFVNVKHAYPKYIYYKKVGESNMLCRIENFKSDPDSQTYYFQKK